MPDEIPTMHEMDEQEAARHATDLDRLLKEQRRAVIAARLLRWRLAEAEEAVDAANLAVMAALVEAVKGLERRP